MNKLSIRLTRAFQGPRHDRLHAIWETVAEHWSPFVTLGVSANTRGFSHAEMFNRMWYEERQRTSRYVLLTEHDFLPNLAQPWWYSNPEAVFDCLDAEHGRQYAALAPEYAIRSPRSHKAIFRDRPGGWWILIDKDRHDGPIDFHGRPDPANQLHESLGGCYLNQGEDNYPQDYGITYPFGHHLFWSRHLNDPPERRVSGFVMGDIQRRHDLYVDNYLSRAPLGFRRIWEARHAKLS